MTGAYSLQRRLSLLLTLLVLALSVLLGMDRFTRLKITGLVLGMAGAVAVVLAGP
jgi:drug/metabolite transporter (DMT)-like permease